jgi:chromosomal replication initiation ATPase DnaA
MTTIFPEIGQILEVPIVPTKIVRMRDVARIVGNVFEIRPERLRSYHRAREIAWPRHAFCSLCYNVLRNTSTEIGRFLNNRDHTTILHAVKQTDNLCECVPEFNKKYEQCRSRIRRYAGDVS